MALTLVSFGSPRLLGENGAAIAFPEKGLLAAGYIASRPKRNVTRAELAAFLWGEDAINPLVNLRQLLARIKARQEEIGIGIFETSATEVAVPRDAIDCDFLQLSELPADRPLKIVEMSLASVTGDFFAGRGFSSDRAELWLGAQQEHALSRFAAAIDALSLPGNLRSHHRLVKQGAYRLLEFNPYDEFAYRKLIDAFTAEGNLTQASATFERYKTLLQKDLNATPDSSMLETRDQIARQALKRSPAMPIGSPSARPVLEGRAALPRLMLMPPVQGAAGEPSMIAGSLIEDVTINLCRTRSALLVAPHTARRVATMADIERQEAFRACGVSYVLETRLGQTTAGTAALFVSLVNIEEDAIVWADRLAVDPANLSMTYATMARHIAAQSVAQIERHEFSRIGRGAAPTAYQNFLLGKHHVRNLELPGIRRARKAFRATLKESPDFAAALAGLSRTEHLEWLLTARGDAALLELAEKHAREAIVVDDHDAAGFHQLAIARLYRGAFDESAELFEIAEHNSPSHADLIADHADALIHASRPAEALAKIMLAFELNPICPDYYWWVAAGANYLLGRYETAIQNLTHVGDQTNVSRVNAACWAMLGDTRKARAYMRRTMEHYPDFEIDRWLSFIPIRDPADRDHYREGLRRAGFK